MLYYLSDLRNFFGPLRLFDYVTFRAGGAAFTAMMFAFIFGPLTVQLLKKLNATAPSRHDGLIPAEFIDRAKDKTPSMGGLLIVAAIALATLLWAVPTNPLVPAFLGTLLCLCGLGFLDDYAKVARRCRDGVSGRLKLVFQFAIAMCAVFFLMSAHQTGDFMFSFMVPLMTEPLFSGLSGAMVSFVVGVFVVVGSSNAVNLTDGKDGLAAGSIIFSAMAFAVFAYVCGHLVFSEYLKVPFIPGSSEVVVFAAAIIGASTGFLWYNCHPASMFMGDTGSLALGGSIGLIAVLVRQELTLALVGGVFVMEALSVIIQVTSFKLTGKRVFLCAPIHHHFERKGWTETQIVTRFWILAGIFAVIGVSTLKLR